MKNTLIGILFCVLFSIILYYFIRFNMFIPLYLIGAICLISYIILSYIYIKDNDENEEKEKGVFEE